jgi:hypothetical protein
LSFCDSKLCTIWLCNKHSQIQQNEKTQSQFVQVRYDHNYDFQSSLKVLKVNPISDEWKTRQKSMYLLCIYNVVIEPQYLVVGYFVTLWLKSWHIVSMKDMNPIMSLKWQSCLNSPIEFIKWKNDWLHGVGESFFIHILENTIAIASYIYIYIYIYIYMWNPSKIGDAINNTMSHLLETWKSFNIWTNGTC